MTRVQFSMTGLLVAVLVLAAACAALMSDQVIVASAVHTIQFGLLTWGVVAIVARRGDKRLFWVGFTVFGVAYWMATKYALPRWEFAQLGVLELEQSDLLSDSFLRFIFGQKPLTLTVGQSVDAPWAGRDSWPAMITEIEENGDVHVQYTDGSRSGPFSPQAIKPSWAPFRSKGHAIICPFIALLGGFLAKIVFGTSNPTNQAAANQADSTARKPDFAIGAAG